MPSHLAPLRKHIGALGGCIACGLMLAFSHAGQAQTDPDIANLPPNPEIEDLIEDIRAGSSALIDDEEGANLIKRYVLKRYQSDNCNSNCTEACANLADYLDGRTDILCRTSSR